MGEAKFNLNDYIQVNDRIAEFYKKYPEGSIQTEIVTNLDGQVIFKAYAYRNQDDKRPATGHAMEKEGSTYINKTSHIENCETSAVGRALAMLGFEIKKSVASREEVQNARNNQENKKPAEVINIAKDKLENVEDKPIDKVKQVTLLTMIKKSGTNEAAMLKFYKVDKIEDIKTSLFMEIMTTLERKIKKNGEKQILEGVI